jgi:hypothetical protein
MEQLSLKEAMQRVNELLKIQRNELMTALENFKVAQSKNGRIGKNGGVGVLTAGIAHEI